jgi:adenosine deaminase
VRLSRSTLSAPTLDTMTPAQRVAPKIELHVHLEGAARPPLLAAIAGRNGLAPGPDDMLNHQFGSLDAFIEVWNARTRCLRTPDDYRLITLAYAAEVAGHGAVYLEAIVDAEERHDDWAGVLAACCDAAAEAAERHGVTIALTPQIFRGYDTARGEQAARVAVRFAGRGVVGFGLSGAEGRRPTAPHVRAVRIAQDGGLPFVPHAGEAAGPRSVREVLDLGAVRIRHGVRAVEDPDLTAELATRGIVLDVTPTSNLRLGIVPSLRQHPLPALVAAGVRCSVSTDDPAIFDTTLSAEYALAHRLGLTPPDAYAAGLTGALCDGATRARLAAIGARAYGPLSSARTVSARWYAGSRCRTPPSGTSDSGASTDR